MCFEEKWDYRYANRTTETSGTTETGASPVRRVCPVRPVKPSVDFLFDDWMYLRLKGAALLWVGKHLGRDASTFFWVGNNLVNNIIGVNRLDAKFV